MLKVSIMRKQYRFLPSILALVAGIGAASAAQADMTSYACQFGQNNPAKLVIEYDTFTGRFGLLDYYGTPNLPTGMQVSVFKADGPILEFTLNAFENGTLTQSSAYRFDFATQQATLEQSSGGQVLATLAGVCATDAPQASAPPPANAPPANTPPAVPASSVSAVSSYHCRFEDRNIAGLTFDYNPQISAFELTDFYGSVDFHVYPYGGYCQRFGAVIINGAMLEFTIERTLGSTLVGGNTFVFNTSNLSATETGDDGTSTVTEQRAGTCTQTAKSGQSAGQAVAEAIAEAALTPAPFISFEPQPRRNTICARDETPTADYTAATWCVSTVASPKDSASFGPESLIDPEAAWCTEDGAWGMMDTVEISFEGLAPGTYIRAVAIVNGASMDSAKYFDYSRPSIMGLEGETGGFRWEILQDRPVYQAIAFDQPLYSDWIRLKITDLFPAINANQNACINQIIVDFDRYAETIRPEASERMA